MKEERLEGYVVDLHCLRTWPAGEYHQRAREHSVTCSLRGICIESGYALIDKQPMPLDRSATPLVLSALRESHREQGVKLRVLRRPRERAMETAAVDLAIAREPVPSSNVLSVGYDDRVLEIEFKNGIYQYLDVPEAIFRAFRSSSSKGRYFNQYIKRRFLSRKIT
jgi:hypothetical protein